MSFYNDTCANCSHASESHEAGSGKCYKCPAERRCVRFIERERCGNHPGMNPHGEACSLDPGHLGDCSWSLTRKSLATAAVTTTVAVAQKDDSRS